MATIFAIDDREQLLRDALEKRLEMQTGMVMVCRRLNMGDVVIQNVDGVSPIVVVERKQVVDVMSSLFDGRLAEQTSRMRDWQMEHNPGEVWVVLIIEGTATVDTFHASDPDARFRHTQCGTFEVGSTLHFL